MKKISVIIFAGFFLLTGSVCSVADGMANEGVEFKSQPKPWKDRTSTRKYKKVSSLNNEPAVPSVIAAVPAPAEPHSIWAYSDATRSWQPYSYP